VRFAATAGAERGEIGGRIAPLSTNATTAAAISAAAWRRERMCSGPIWPRIKATTPKPNAARARLRMSPPATARRAVTMRYASLRSAICMPSDSPGPA